ncbi:uncharacterized protein BDZ99DRAFT_524240 [Mytilinidion resinicola]|uniref:Uncharacterized protein n=1 Tax=Mytilinidion resinicola TaxID=574789 RepID=A0A6A6YB04_9PEZI|nr:uncharacterized protein BDZ99DRAFT_524240 [Mytilinidion resinicola]KAF2806006.1 hypothetical protein BDZ99DRAFT_524240 [Mytilinidion resinicola]
MLYGWNDCSDGEKGAILDALKEKSTVVGTQSTWTINWNGALVVQFFGSPTGLLFKDYRQKLQDNFHYAYKFGNGNWFTGYNTQVLCHDKSLDGDHKDDYQKPDGWPGHIIVVSNYADGHDAIMFCDSWFRLPPLKGAMEIGRSKGNDRDRHNLNYYDNRAIHWITVLMMKHDVGVKTWVSDARTVEILVLERDLDYLRPLESADTYGRFAIASYIQDDSKWGWYPARPYVPTDLE